MQMTDIVRFLKRIEIHYDPNIYNPKLNINTIEGFKFMFAIKF